ncbi:MAG: hypothetical protein NVSMB12_05800 [Acidimicrobiales bacterium]
MIPRRVIINLFVFFGLTLLLVAYGFFSLVSNPLKTPMRLYAYIDDTGGVRTGFTVALRGVPVGHVGALRLADAKQPDGSTVKKVKLTLSIDEGVSVPADSQVQVERANPLGEQQVDLLPAGGTAAPVRPGTVLPASSTPTPPEVGQVVDAADRLFASVPTDQLGTIVHELALAFAGRGQDIRTLIEAGDTFSRNTVAYEAAFRSLLDNAPPVLDTVASVGPQLQESLRNTEVLAELLARRKDDLINLAHTGTSFAQVTTQLMNDNTANLACLAHDFGDVGANLSVKANLDNLDTALMTNRAFFGPINSLSPQGHAVSLGAGSVERNDQTWLRVRTLLPPQQPSAISYVVPNRIPDTYPGAACLSVFGPGVPAASQTDAALPAESGKVIPASAPTVPAEKLPPPTPENGGSGAGNVLPPAGQTTPGQRPAAAASSPALGMGASPAPARSSSRLALAPAGRVAHPETMLFVGAGLAGLGALERRELARLRRARRRRARTRRSSTRKGRFLR